MTYRAVLERSTHAGARCQIAVVLSHSDHSPCADFMRTYRIVGEFDPARWPAFPRPIVEIEPLDEDRCAVLPSPVYF
jgi:hypothetical protein